MTSKTKSQAVENPAGERIAKVMARAGVASRRGAEAIIAAGRVTLNGKKLDTPAVTVSKGDDIRVDGKPLPRAQPARLWRYHKPPGLLTTNRDDEGRPTIFEKLPENLPRVITVGRLDMGTEGLLLLTNDGELARHLELPQTGWLRRYRVRAFGRVDQSALDGLRDGPVIEGVTYGSVIAKIERQKKDNVWLTVDLREGKNREVKRVLASLGLDVNRLIRVSYGPFTLEEMARGEVREVPRRILSEQIPDRFRPTRADRQEAEKTETGDEGRTRWPRKRTRARAGKPADGPMRGRTHTTNSADETRKSAGKADGRGKTKPGSDSGSPKRKVTQGSGKPQPSERSVLGRGAANPDSGKPNKSSGKPGASRARPGGAKPTKGSKTTRPGPTGPGAGKKGPHADRRR